MTRRGATVAVLVYHVNLARRTRKPAHAGFSSVNEARRLKLVLGERSRRLLVRRIAGGNPLRCKDETDT
jgi:hypothetical protein